MNDKELIRSALEALESCSGAPHWETLQPVVTALRKALANEALDKKAENARELGLDYEPAQQEPVVWMYVNKSTHETKFQKHMRDFVDHSLWSEVPLYGEPLANHELQCVCGAVWLGDELVHLPDKRPPAQQESVDFASLLREAEELVREKPTWKRFIEGTPLSNDIAVWMTVFAQDVARRTSPPAQRTWVGLTDEEMYRHCPAWLSQSEFKALMLHVEAKLKAKNSL